MDGFDLDAMWPVNFDAMTVAAMRPLLQLQGLVQGLVFIASYMPAMVPQFHGDHKDAFLLVPQQERVLVEQASGYAGEGETKYWTLAKCLPGQRNAASR